MNDIPNPINDIINDMKAKEDFREFRTNLSLIISIVSLLVMIADLIVSILKS